MPPDASGFEIIASTDDGMVRVAGEVDAATADQIADAVAEVLDTRLEVVLDLSQVTYMDSSGLRALILCRQAAEGRSARFEIGSTSPEVARLLEITGLAETLLGGPSVRPDALGEPG